jgi:hypothetical protein
MQHFDDPREQRESESQQDRVRRNQAEREQLYREGAIRPYSHFSRAAYGSWWGFITLILTVAFFIGLSQGAFGAALIVAVLLFLSARYTWRLWTWQASRLVFFIIF